MLMTEFFFSSIFIYIQYIYFLILWFLFYMWWFGSEISHQTRQFWSLYSWRFISECIVFTHHISHQHSVREQKCVPRVHPSIHSLILAAWGPTVCPKLISNECYLTYRHIFWDNFWHTKSPLEYEMYLFLQYCSLSNPTALRPFPPPSPVVVEGFHMGAVVAWRMYTVRRACRAQHGAWLGKMEGGQVSHATRLVAILTLVYLCVSGGGFLLWCFLHTLAV